MTERDVEGDGSPLLTVRIAAARLEMSEARLRSLIVAGRVEVTRQGRRVFVPTRAIDTFLALRQARVEELRRTQPTAWDWEGTVVQQVRRHLAADGWTLVRQADPIIREPGVDLEMRKDGRTLVVEAKGWPVARRVGVSGQIRAPRYPHTMARNYMGDLMMTVILRRQQRPSDLVALAVPDRETFTTLIRELTPTLQELRIGAFVVQEDGTVQERLSSRGRVAT